MITVSQEIALLPNGFNLKLTIVESSILPKEVFLFKILPDMTYEFSSLCSIHSLTNFPNEVTPGVCMVRKEHMELFFSTAQSVLDYINKIKVELNQLESDYSIYSTDLTNTTFIIE